MPVHPDVRPLLANRASKQASERWLHPTARQKTAIQLHRDGEPVRDQVVEVAEEHQCHVRPCAGVPWKTGDSSGVGDDAFLECLHPTTKKLHNWHRATDLMPARARLKPGDDPISRSKGTIHMSAELEILNLATALAATKGISLGRAACEVATEQMVQKYREEVPVLDAVPSSESVAASDVAALRAIAERLEKASTAEEVLTILRSMPAVDAAPTSPVLSLSARPGESFDALAQQIARDRGIPLREAIHQAGLARPDLAASR